MENCLETCEILAIFLAKFCEEILPEYFRSLPDKIDHCLYWSESDIKKLDDNIKSEVLRYKKDFQKHQQRVSRFFKIEEENFRSAWVRLNTRTIYLPGRISEKGLFEIF